jgi:hypothetical protein
MGHGASYHLKGSCHLTVTAKKWIRTLAFFLTPVLRYSEEPDIFPARPGSSEYLRTGVSKGRLGCENASRWTREE